ncbi:hypothetical protein SAMN04489729_4311 [Amycolatopsis lurida]|uniref:Uncharacterized protein n=1 Tax=Amycolatopsis lurida NRRL 2430 TaxID=1460371 RepID=A0A2P2FVN4_AMYLU|nr:LapA family protein [Amycolatopsis lurida]KFU80745.1 hypothetical protein BB31_14380 [Amycolatopsis lurida NRRL 2430]SED42678.1 hypothetical protein SAMN04489729_4311 [Amycolatopsis lurida]
MSIFGQVWLWSLLAFVVGALLTWLVLVLPARKRIRELESSLATAHAETSRLPAGVSLGAGAAAVAGGTAYLAKPSHDELDEEFAAVEEPSKPAYPETLTEQEPAQQWTEPAEEPVKDEEPAEEPEHSSTQIFEPEEEYEAEYRTAPQPDPEPEPDAELAAERTQYIPAALPEPEPEPEPQPENPYVAAATDYLQPASQLDVEPEPEPEPQPSLPGEGPYRSRLEMQLDPEGAETQPEPVSLFSPASRVETEQAPVETNWFEREEELHDPPPAYAFGSDEEAKGGLLDSEPETPAEATQVLPKRTPRGAVRGGFEPPQPIQPSMRAIERREPELSGGQSGSLFEPAVQPGDAMPAPEPPPARQVAPVTESVPPGPFGPGSAMPRPGGGRPADDFAVKASVTALRYCTEDSPQFPKMVAEVWFRSAADAERVGFRPLT